MTRGRLLAALAAACVAAALFASRAWRAAPESRAQPEESAQARSAHAGGQGEVSGRLTRRLTLPAPVARPARSQVVISGKDRKLIGDLRQILASKNDNDPRLDTEFRDLSEGTKLLLRQEYDRLAPESLNERGTIVFLIGRELKEPQDFAFLAQVGNQQPCLSLGDCKKESLPSEGSMHEEVAVSVTLTYPQRVALKSLENLLSRPDVPQAQAALALGTLDAITESPVPWVAQQARGLESRWSPRR